MKKSSGKGNKFSSVALKTIVVMAMVFFIFPEVGVAELINIEKLADAIYLAENSKSHPYGILAHYKTTSPRQACLNTIRHAVRDWDGKCDFIVFLGSRYCPPNIHPLNKNWGANVKFFYERGEK